MAVEPVAIRRGTIVLVRFPKDKARPAVVVRSDLLAELTYATVLPITPDLRDGVSLRINLEPSQTKGLRQPSQVMVDWPQTLRFSDMGEAIGRLDSATMELITRQLAVALGIGAGTGGIRQRNARGKGYH
jgi:mRNA interferase MazF